MRSGISKCQMNRIYADIDIKVQAFFNRPLEESGYAYNFLDALPSRPAGPGDACLFQSGRR